VEFDMPHIVFLYAGLMALLYLVLSVRTLRMRRRLRIAIGDAGNEAMLRAIRAHSNCAEYVPLSLLMLYFVEAAGTPPLFVHVFGLCVLFGRICHAYGVSQVKENYAFRTAGMVLTLTPVGIAAGWLLWIYLIRILM
jgi:uncharacterized membrane protein YecN with MAPEG domain